MVKSPEPVNKEKIQKAQTLYEGLIKSETIARNYRKIMHCLPKKKIPKYEKLLAVAVMNWMNAKARFNEATKKLTPPELLELHNTIHLR